MNHHKEALQKILELDSIDNRVTVIAQQALEQSEPRNFSEEEVLSIVESLRCALVAMKRDCDFLYAIDKTEEALCKWDKLQSLSPKSEPTRVYSEEEDKLFKFLLGEGDIDGLWFGDKKGNLPFWWRKLLRDYVLKTRIQSLSPKEVKPIATLPIPCNNFEPSKLYGASATKCKWCGLGLWEHKKELQPKESIEAMAEKEYPLVEGEQGLYSDNEVTLLERKAIIKGHSLGKLSVINELEEFVKSINLPITPSTELLTKLNTLKQKEK